MTFFALVLKLLPQLYLYPINTKIGTNIKFFSTVFKIAKCAITVVNVR